MEHRIQSVQKEEKIKNSFDKPKSSSESLAKDLLFDARRQTEGIAKTVHSADHMHELSNMQYYPSQAWLIK